MVIDTSAVAAILFDEPDAATLEGKIADDPVRLMSAATFLEAAIVIEARLGNAGGREFDLWLHRADIEILGVDADQADLARRAWRRFGRGRHPADLNYGDCFSYALAAARDEPLLFKGDDFAKTDVKACA
ncbi:MAG: type II toxin-antitoxin system VapC family toxin [Alphaproteobacteria bacterium]|nr:type II toxin-antitoxin system VapC family toxin [Alphaproteobacteria bacterium]